ncbi:MAG: hypothetical protein SF069_12920 [Phycisphaerae bacterium]|nr:hypothetical protein [Phycisphaerae bacterium]
MIANQTPRGGGSQAGCLSGWRCNAVIVGLLLCGCVTPPPTGNGNSNSADAGLEPGAYSGNLTVVVELFLNEQSVDTQSSTRAVTETIGTGGLPLVSTGQELAVGTVLTLLEIGNESVNGTVTSITEVANSVVVALQISGSRDGISVAGIGETVYRRVSATQMDLLLSLEFSGVNSAGDVVRQVETQEGRLSR